jgi:hypothetical protein
LFLAGAFLPGHTGPMRCNSLSSSLSLALALGVTVGGAGCAASFNGEIDNKSIPSFSNAAFGQADTDQLLGARVRLIVGVLAPGDSCADGAEFLKLNRRLNEANGADERKDRAQDIADLMNEKLPEDSWYGLINITALDDDDLDDTGFDFDKQDDGINMSFQLCQRQGEVDEVDGAVDSDDDCFVAVDGDVDITRSDDEASINLVSDGGVDFNDDTGRDEGAVDFTIGLGECEDMTDEVERSVD